MTIRGQFLAVALVCCAAATSPAFGEDAEYTQCMETAGGVTVDMLDCIGAALSRADEALNVAWEEGITDVDAEVGAKLRDAQRQWILYRDTTCDAEAAIWGKGSFAGVASADCQLRVTQERVEWLGNVFSPDGAM